QPSDDPPVRYNGRCWIRVGTRRATATAVEEVRLAEKRRYHDVPFDARPVPTASLADLDLELFRRRYIPGAVAPEVIEENNRTIEDQLKATRFAAIGQPIVPTVIGCLVVGKDPTVFLPGAYIQFLRVDGLSLTDSIKDQERISGP